MAKASQMQITISEIPAMKIYQLLIKIPNM